MNVQVEDMQAGTQVRGPVMAAVTTVVTTVVATVVTTVVTAVAASGTVTRSVSQSCNCVRNHSSFVAATETKSQAGTASETKPRLQPYP